MKQQKKKPVCFEGVKSNSSRFKFRPIDATHNGTGGKNKRQVEKEKWPEKENFLKRKEKESEQELQRKELCKR